MKKCLIWAALLVLPLRAPAQETPPERLDSVVVSASRAGGNTPVTYDNVGKDALERTNPMYSLPMALNLLPSVVTYNEGGTGLGNSSMTIRGSKGSQINVTLNGITLNDAESQEVFWVNIPSLTALLSSVQVQRGLGTSANGAGAFGASVNMNTALVGTVPTAALDVSAGSYGTLQGSLAASTGRLKSGWYFNVAANLGRTDGYIRHAMVQSSSVFAVLGWMRGPRSLRLTYLMGRQTSGITWDGISLEQYALDRRFNTPNQTDHYAQRHLQLNYTRAFGAQWTWSNTFNYTRGDGYDQYPKYNKKLRNYGFPADTDPARSDIRYRKKMDNDYWVLNSNLKYRSERLNLTLGANGSWYRGSHWGEVLWVQSMGDVTSPDWYSNEGRKLDLGAFLRAEWRPLPWLTGYADLQYRSIRYALTGVDDDWIEYGRAEADRFDYRPVWRFFNPRAGVTAAWKGHKLYASVAMGHREPGRGDIKENIKGSGAPIRPERMVDVEAGYQFTGEHVVLSVNLYAMEYRDMLLETGRLSDSGYAIKENVPRSWRRGVELSAACQPFQWLRVDGNATLSRNEIADYTAYVPYEDYSATIPVHYGRTTMLLSPSVTGMFRLGLYLWKGGSIGWSGKYVGKQYLDNSMREELAVPACFVSDASVSQRFRLGLGHIDVSLYLNNFFNHLYYASGWRWEAYKPDSDTFTTGVGVYPQAPFNLNLRMRYSF